MHGRLVHRARGARSRPAAGAAPAVRQTSGGAVRLSLQVNVATAAFLLVLGALATAGCGGSASSAPTGPVSHRVVERFYGRGADSVWVFRRQNERPKAVVVFLH